MTWELRVCFTIMKEVLGRDSALKSGKDVLRRNSVT